MPILTKSPVTKGTPAPVTLAVADLALVAKVAANTYFSNTNKWKTVAVTYKSTVSEQNKTLIFKGSELEPQTTIKLSASANDVFEVKFVTIFDFDGGSLVLDRADLPVADFDIDLSSVGGPAQAGTLLLDRNYGAEGATLGMGENSGSLTDGVYSVGADAVPPGMTHFSHSLVTSPDQLEPGTYIVRIYGELNSELLSHVKIGPVAQGDASSAVSGTDAIGDYREITFDLLEADAMAHSLNWFLTGSGTYSLTRWIVTKL